MAKSENSARRRRPNLSSGEVEIAQYGLYEDMAAFRNTGFKAVRFDPPFNPPYTITRIEFPSLTFNGVPAVFPSVRLCEANSLTGLPDLTSPLFQLAPYAGSSDGVNEIPVNIPITEPNKTYYWCVEFPSSAGSTFPNDYPFLRMDYQDLERGLFANSYDLPLVGRGSLSLDRNIIVSMFCQLASPDSVPIGPSSNLGANRQATKTEFFFVRPSDTRADGTRMRRNSLLRTDLLRRSPFGPWIPFASAEARTGTIAAEAIPNEFLVWTTQAIDRNGHRAVPSSVTITSFFVSGLAMPTSDDADEPNGSLDESTVISLPTDLREETYWPAGDKDFFTFEANPGDFIQASATRTGNDRPNNLDLVMFLYNQAGRAVAYDDNSSDGANPRITFVVPSPVGKPRRGATHRFTVLVTDIRGSLLSRNSAPRVIFPFPDYLLSVSATPTPVVAQSRQSANGEEFDFRIRGPSLANPRPTLEYVLPQSANGQRVVIRIFDVRGRLVRRLLEEATTAGAHALVWDGRDDWGRGVSSGTYYVRFEAGSIRRSERTLVVK